MNKDRTKSMKTKNYYKFLAVLSQKKENTNAIGIFVSMTVEMYIIFQEGMP